MLLIYDLLFLLTIIICSPFLLVKSLRKKKLSFSGEFSQNPIWFHAASVGEINGLYPIIDELSQRNKYLEFAITTYTRTGLKRAKEIFLNYPVRHYSILPLDFSLIVKRFIRKMHPAAVVISETELWPNLIFQAKKCGVKVIVVSGRVSDKAWPRYSRFRLFFKNVVNKIDFYCAQTETDKSRIVSLGLSPDRVEITGNSKYSFMPKITREISIDLSRPIIVAGSTRPGEEAIILEAFKMLLASFKNATLVIAPRHLNRVSEVKALAKKMLLPSTIIVLDTIGELSAFYRLSDLSFVGGTIAPFGGHNILEPAAFKKPVLFGPFVNNVKEIADDMEGSGGGKIVHDAEELGRAFVEIISDENKKVSMGENAYNVFLKHRRSAKKQAEIIEKYV